jgi:hypothetical protein
VGGCRVEHRFRPRVGEVAQPEGQGLLARGLGQLVHEGFDREHVGERAERAQRRGPKGQAAHQVLHQARTQEGVERLEIAVNPDVARHRRLRDRFGQGVCQMPHREKPPGSHALRAGARPHRIGIAERFLRPGGN